jgi:hypothetical protein
MSTKTKMIAFSAAAVLAAAAGIYAFGPSGRENVAESSEVAKPAPPVALPDKSSAPAMTAAEKAIDPAAEPKAAQPQAAPEKAASQPPVKLTREQLIPPPPKTEDEKLQKAAEQEYNRF